MYERLGSFVSRHWVLAIVGWGAVALGLHLAAPEWQSVARDGDLAYLPDEMTSVQAERLLARAFPQHQGRSQFVLVCAREEGRLEPSDRDLVERLGQSIEKLRTSGLPVADVWTPRSAVVGDKLVSPDGRAALVVVILKREFMATSNIEALQQMRRHLDRFRHEQSVPPSLRLGITGSAAIGGDMLTAAKESIQNTELATVLTVLAILLLVYRAPLLAAVPLATIAVSGIVALELVAWLAGADLPWWLSWLRLRVFTTTRIFIVVLLFGCGTDYCLFLIARYREELAKGLAPREAAGTALGKVSQALVASALTTIAGLAVMAFAAFGKYRHSGPAIAVCLVVALAASLTLAPALLRVFGHAVFWPWDAAARKDRSPQAVGRLHPFARREDQPADAPSRPAGLENLWPTLARGIIRRPALILGCALAILTPFAWYGLDVPANYDLLAELDASRPSVQGTQLLRRHFFAGETGPVTLVATMTGTPSNPPGPSAREPGTPAEPQSGGRSTLPEVRNTHAADGEAPGRIAAAGRIEHYDSRAGRRAIALLTRALYETVVYTVLPPERGNARAAAEAQRLLALRPESLAEQVEPLLAPFTAARWQQVVRLPSGVEVQAARPIASVRSLTEPLGDRPGLANAFSSQGRRKLSVLRHPRTRAYFVSQAGELRGRVTRFELVLRYDPFSLEAVQLLDLLQARVQAVAADPNSAWYGTQFHLAGTTAGCRDLRLVTQADQVLIQRLTTLAVLAVLLLILRRTGMTLYLMFSVLFSYFVTLGATALVFGARHAGTPGIDWKLPLFLFVILVAVGQDYNIYLVTRVLEEQPRHGRLKGLQRALVHTGGIITSCGVIMAATFATMLTGSLRGIRALGFALSLGVLLDTFVVRTVLVPALLALVYQWREKYEAKRQAQQPLKEELPEQVAAELPSLPASNA
jgi:uncharacterized membrane protein YdfJ with MMPL/SSD domain